MNLTETQGRHLGMELFLFGLRHFVQPHAWNFLASCTSRNLYPKHYSSLTLVWVCHLMSHSAMATLLEHTDIPEPERTF